MNLQNEMTEICRSIKNCLLENLWFWGSMYFTKIDFKIGFSLVFMLCYTFIDRYSDMGISENGSLIIIFYRACL